MSFRSKGPVKVTLLESLPAHIVIIADQLALALPNVDRLVPFVEATKARPGPPCQ
ncbi:unannotated protein [freshwater metagenome]|uniref:Unannotated protein n=1 Tax=freshwater metagenome TaxID=449393 RepID=A0A6J7DWZ5_9ZZZZ